MRVDLWTDGGCWPNPGPGGWAFILVAYGAKQHWMDYAPKIGELSRSGYCAETTNNRMELTAVIRGLRALQRPTTVTVHSDSAYVVNTMRGEWWKGWQRRGWLSHRKVDGEHQAVKNRDLWEQLIAVSAPHKITWMYVKGHNGSHYNERCDQLATRAYREVAA